MSDARRLVAAYSWFVLNTTPSKANQRPLTGPVLTTVPFEIPPVNPIVTTPIYIRLPKSGTACVWTGLSRSALNALILGKNPPIKSVSVRQPHAIRGTRLILLSSLLDYLAGLGAAQNPTNSAAAHAAVEDVDNNNKPTRHRGRTSKNPAEGKKLSATKKIKP